MTPEGTNDSLVSEWLRGGIPKDEWPRAVEVASQLARSDPATAAQLFDHAGVAAEHTRQPTDAIHHATSAMLLYASLEDDRATASARAAMGRLEQIVDPGTWLREASTLHNAMITAGVVEVAVELAEAVVAYADALPESTHARLAQAQARTNLGSALIRAVRHEEALKILSAGLDLAPSDAHEAIGNLHFAMGTALAELGQAPAAQNAYTNAREAFVAAGSDPIDLAYLDRQEAAALARLGHFSEARDHFERARLIFEARQLQQEVDRTLVGLVQTMYMLGVVFSTEELDAFEAAADRLSPAESLGMGLNLANISYQQGDSRADRLYQTFAARARKLGRPIDAAKFDSAYAVVLRDRGEIDEALQLNRQASAAFLSAGLPIERLNADYNYTLLLEEQAKHGRRDDSFIASIRADAADIAVDWIDTLDVMRHRLPTAADRYALITRRYPEAFTIAIGACFRARRWDEVAALVEKSRTQPVLRSNGPGFIDPAPVAAHPTATAVGGRGQPVVLTELVRRQFGRPGSWFGWWTHNGRLIRTRSSENAAECESGPLDETALRTLAQATPVVLADDLEAAGGDEALAALLALWRAAQGPLVHDTGLAGRLASVLPEPARARIGSESAVIGVWDMTADQVLWPIAEMLLSNSWRAELLQQAGDGQRHAVVVAPPQMLGRIPWAALPLTDPDQGPPRHLIEIADVLVGPPATLAAGPHVGEQFKPSTDGLVIADPIGNLPFASRLRPPGMKILGALGDQPATRANFLRAILNRPRVLVLNAHVVPGSELDPASASVLLARSERASDPDPVTVHDLAQLGVPALCIVLGCDGAGAATGTEWTGIATGLMWGGARQVIATTAPVIDDAVAVHLDLQLVNEIQRGDVLALCDWQRQMCRLWKLDPNRSTNSPYRWAQLVALRVGAVHGDGHSRP